MLKKVMKQGKITDIEQFKKERLQAIIDDRQSGSTELGRLALSTLADFSQVCTAEQGEQYRQQLQEFASSLQHSRPSIAPLYNLIQSWRLWLEAERVLELQHLRELALNTAHDLINQSENAVVKIAETVNDLIQQDSVVLTHSVSSTILTCFSKLVDKDVKAIITESAPGNEGRRVAKFLAELAVSAEYITDSQIGIFMKKADVVIVGADALLADRAIVNKAGTYPLALLAQHAQVPFYVCAESFKQSQFTSSTFEIEEMETDELDLPQLPHITPRNVYFDITPGELITGWVSEHGMQRI